jgi:hypothetical protein
VWVSTHAGRRDSLCWGPPCDTPKEAQRLGQAELDVGNAALLFVVRMGADGKNVCHTWTRPQSARKVIQRQQVLEEALDAPPA